MGDAVFRQNWVNARGAIWLVALFLLASLPVLAQPKAVASLKPARMETGDTTVLMVLATGMGAQPQAVDFSSWADVFPAANILRRGEWQRSGAQWVRRFTLIAFDSANLELPALKVRLQDGKILETNVLKLSVFPTRASREIRDMAKIRDIRREPESWLDYWPWGAGLLSALLLLVWWLRKNQHKPLPIVVQAVPEAPPPSASELALQKISQLQQKQLWKNGELKVHYAELSLIIREYLEGSYGIAALESTTSEIQKMLKATSFPAELQQDLKALLQKTDMVKYAQSQPPASVHEQVLEEARHLVAPDLVKKQEPKKTPSANSPQQKTKGGAYEPL